MLISESLMMLINLLFSKFLNLVFNYIIITLIYLNTKKFELVNTHRQVNCIDQANTNKTDKRKTKQQQYQTKCSPPWVMYLLMIRALPSRVSLWRRRMCCSSRPRRSAYFLKLFVIDPRHPITMGTMVILVSHTLSSSTWRDMYLFIFSFSFFVMFLSAAIDVYNYGLLRLLVNQNNVWFSCWNDVIRVY